MAEGETTKMDPQNSIEEPNHPVGESVAPEHKKPKHHQPCEDRAEPHNPFDASHAESQSRSPVTPDEPNHDETESQTQSPPTVVDVTKEPIKTEVLASSEDSGRDRLKRHRVEVAGRVWIPDIWGQEELMKDWTDCSVFDASLVSSRIMSARAALMAEGRRPNSSRLRIENRC
ncbi:hypothetical protein VitviT2T_023362 [Vitis vinifera]|uniref:Protein BIC1 n=2 Tax=Vitis vinifera TaxID=29760 RepID=F6GV83_VITVI|nr:protein BIC1 [Vitis vinifera]RVW62395.1 Protein BIC1 [Vitis vinifera]WKA05392.1 hypothetical protein VitviT2T_023362 [Vitis vinifera]|eukprot:XP_010661366.1 PREDICTED: uncharacterized protein LOC104881801 [Vitis vinifera]